MRAETLLALLLAAPAAAGDLGESASFPSWAGPAFAVKAGGPAAAVVFDTGDSAPLAEDWDTVLVHGVLPDPAVRLQVRRGGGGAAWTDMTLRRFPGGRFWARARLAPGAGAVRVRALDDGAAADHDADLFSVEVYASGPAAAATPEPAPPRAPADPSAPAPPFHARDRWGAVPPREPYSPDPLPWRMTLHHTDGRRTATLAESLAEARFIQDFHQNGRGWSDIGYHFLVDSAGNILEGRPLGVLGAHTLNNNEGNVGFVLMGRHHPPKNEAVTPAQLDAVAALGRWLVARYGLAADSLKGHRDYKSTDCPGDRAYPHLPALIGRIAQTAQTSAAKPSTTR